MGLTYHRPVATLPGIDRSGSPKVLAHAVGVVIVSARVDPYRLTPGSVWRFPRKGFWQAA
jgi:hypothetical protein